MLLLMFTTGLGFVCFVVINPHVLSANRVDLGFFFCFINFPIQPAQVSYEEVRASLSICHMVPFSSARKRMSTVVDFGENRREGLPRYDK